MSGPGHSVNIGGSFTGSFVQGDRNVVGDVNAHSGAAEATRADLVRLLTDLRVRAESAGLSNQDQVLTRIDDLTEEATAGSPEQSVVRRSYERLQKALAHAADLAGHVAKIGEYVRALFG